MTVLSEKYDKCSFFSDWRHACVRGRRVADTFFLSPSARGSKLLLAVIAIMVYARPFCENILFLRQKAAAVACAARE